MPQIWFRAKRYGYGWYPATWQGWAVIGAYVALILLPVFYQRYVVPTFMTKTQFSVVFIPYVVVLVAILIGICHRKGEPARWRWGGK
jgi:hypothetical protein